MTDLLATVWLVVQGEFAYGPPSLVVLLGFLVLYCFLAQQKPSRWALVPVGMFVALYALNLLWQFVADIPPAVGKMVAGKFVPFDETQDAELMAALAFAQQVLAEAVQRQGMTGAESLVVAVTQPELVNELDWAKKVFLTSIYGTALVYCYAWFYEWWHNPGRDLLAILMAAGLVFAETWTQAIHVLGCDVILAGADRVELNRTWGGAVSARVCDRELFWGFDALAMSLVLGVMFWIAYRYSQAKEKALAPNDNG